MPIRAPRGLLKLFGSRPPTRIENCGRRCFAEQHGQRFLNAMVKRKLRSTLRAEGGIYASI